jgi:Ni,Fe-hydrogenase maturation factor
MIHNIDLRNTINDLGITYRMIASHMNITPEYLSRAMGRPLTANMERRIMRAVEELAAERGKDGNNA